MSTPTSRQTAQQPQATRMQRQPTNTSVSTPPASGAGTNIAATPHPMSTPGRSPRVQGNAVRSGFSGKSLGPSSLGMSSPAALASFTPQTGLVKGSGFDTPPGMGPLDVASTGSTAMGTSLSNMGLGGSGVLLGGVGMSTGLSMLGTEPTLSTLGRLDEAERTRRLEVAIDALGKKSGRVSKEGVERLGRRVGLDTLWEGQVLSLAGSTIVVDVEFAPGSNSQVDRVALAYHGLSDAVSEHAGEASQVMHNDLKLPQGKTNVNASLDSFADNLERLARMDKLSVPSASCFEAVSGIYTSLKRIYNHEKKLAETLQSDNSSRKENRSRVSMHRRSGRPRLHARQHVGLSVDYWSNEHLIEHEPQIQANDAAMEIDDKEQDMVTDERGVHSLIIECEHCPPALYAPIRVSPDWIAERVQKPKEPQAEEGEKMEIDDKQDSDREYDWLEPAPPAGGAAAAAAAGAEAMNMETAGPAPQPTQARFTAKFEPTVALPYTTAMQIYAIAGIDIGHEQATETFEGAVLRELQQQPLPGDGRVEQGAVQEASGGMKQMRVLRSGCEDDSIQETVLYVPRSEGGHRMSRIPFTHPKQLVSMLPTLRQYAFLATVLRNSFEEKGQHTNEDRKSVDDELDELLDTNGDGHGAETRRADVTLSMQAPNPQLNVRLGSAAGLKSIQLSVLPNAEVVVDTHDLAAAAGDADTVRQQLAQALMVCEDLGVWIEWVRGKYTNPSC